jgi:DNA-binding transcriptional ArsR family regulator
LIGSTRDGLRRSATDSAGNPPPPLYAADTVGRGEGERPGSPLSIFRSRRCENPFPRITALRPGLVGKLNERQVLRLIQARGPISLAEVARLTGLSPPTVSKAAASLIRAGLLEETATSDNARGRPAVNLRLASEAVQVLGIVIDAGRCEVVTAGLDGVLAGRVAFGIRVLPRRG